MPIPDPALLAFCRSQAPWLRETIEALVTLESPSDQKAAVPLGDWLVADEDGIVVMTAKAG